jgi:hypothetical protein
MLTTELSSHRDLPTACGKSGHTGQAVKSNTGPKNLFTRDYRPTSLQLFFAQTKPVDVFIMPRLMSRVAAQATVTPVSGIRFVSKLPKPADRRLPTAKRVVQTAPRLHNSAQNCPTGSFFQPAGHRPPCTNLHKHAQICTKPPGQTVPLTPTIPSPLSKIGFVPQKTSRPTFSAPVDAVAPAGELSVHYRPESGPHFDQPFEI